MEYNRIFPCPNSPRRELPQARHPHPICTPHIKKPSFIPIPSLTRFHPPPPQSSPPISSSSQSVAAAAAAPSVGFVDRPPLFHFRQLDSQRWTLLLANSKTIIWPKILGQCAREETISTSSIRRQVRIQSGKTIPKILIGWHLIQQE
ncbi:uncharacterized protein LOC123442087 [Hordeum vulgare subsp. vulgare]|uniref:uncharacterized protein LOC123442087 n=1 Tax=Hordeum vulgare subsp. vulgare TaxID=112509 RepID=UPI001D1A497B|nr:uncharacterized protein LOC123442087 [Hordeum vulgare subsp. vulgare]